MPVIALSLAMSFGLYGLVKKKVGASLEAMHSLTAETAVLAPIAVVMLAVLTSRGDTTFTTDGGWHTTLLVAAGVATAAPLLLFAAAARRVPLVTIGLLQFITPVLQLLCGVLLLDEHMSRQPLGRLRHRLGGAGGAEHRLDPPPAATRAAATRSRSCPERAGGPAGGD